MPDSTRHSALPGLQLSRPSLGKATVRASGARPSSGSRLQTCPTPSGSGGNIKVCVRVRPFNRRELNSNESRCVHVRSQTEVVLTDILDAEKPFNFDRAYDSSIDPSSEDYASQASLMEDLGVELKKNALEGYNSCLFAYGQTGSGKTFSVLGSSDQPGLLPCVTSEVFDSLVAGGEGMGTYSCSVAYLEIYMETLRDLLAPPGDSTRLEVRHCPQVGVYIQNLKETPVFTKQDVGQLLEFGAKNRMVASTCMNDQSSRSHCIFTLEIRRKIPGQDGAPAHSLRSKLNLVDLAGSERQKRTQAAGGTLKEGAAINQSLSHLANVIFKLAEMSEKKPRLSSGEFVPFRNSKLTMALMDSLGGNSKTIMIAALSPAEINYDETLSTLQFAKRVKVVKTIAKQNAESEGSLVERLKVECEQLKAQIAKGHADRLERNQLEGLEALVEKYGQDLESQLDLARQMRERRSEALQELGLTSAKIGESLGLDESTPQLVNISNDPSLVGCLVYFLTQGDPIAVGSTSTCKIRLTGLGMKPTMAVIHNRDNLTISIEANQGRVLVNGKLLRGELQLKHCDRLILGHAYCFRVIIPLATLDEARHAEQMHDLEVALSEVVPCHSDSYEKCKFYVRELQDRIGQEKAQSFLQEFRKVLALVDEANAITLEVRPCEGLRFYAEVMTDLFRYQQEEPEVVVRLKRVETGWTRIRTLMRRSRMTRTRLLARKEETTHKPSSADLEEETFETVAVLDMASFERRLGKLRAIYNEWACERASDAESEDSPEEREDPFGEVSGAEEARHTELRSEGGAEAEREELRSAREESTSPAARASASSRPRRSNHGRRSLAGKPSLQAVAKAFSEKGCNDEAGLRQAMQEQTRLLEEERAGRLEELGALREQLGAERRAWEELHAAQEERIARLESAERAKDARIAELEAQLRAAAPAKPQEAAAVCRSSRALKQQLRKDGAELVEAARLASKLIKGMQGVRRGLTEQGSEQKTPRRKSPDRLRLVAEEL